MLNNNTIFPHIYSRISKIYLIIKIGHVKYIIARHSTQKAQIRDKKK